MGTPRCPPKRVNSIPQPCPVAASFLHRTSDTLAIFEGNHSSPPGWKIPSRFFDKIRNAVVSTSAFSSRRRSLLRLLDPTMILLRLLCVAHASSGCPSVGSQKEWTPGFSKSFPPSPAAPGVALRLVHRRGRNHRLQARSRCPNPFACGSGQRIPQPPLQCRHRHLNLLGHTGYLRTLRRKKTRLRPFFEFVAVSSHCHSSMPPRLPRYRGDNYCDTGGGGHGTRRRTTRPRTMSTTAVQIAGLWHDRHYRKHEPRSF